MAKKSKIVRNEQRKVIVARYAPRRAELKETLRAAGSTEEQRDAAERELRRQAEGVLPRLRPVPVRLREMAHRGELPGVRKSSW
jgi:small subunit ribosomal protein S14